MDSIIRLVEQHESRLKAFEFLFQHCVRRRLVPKLQLGNAYSGSSASRSSSRSCCPPRQGISTGDEVQKTQCAEAELRGPRSQAGAWERDNRNGVKLGLGGALDENGDAECQHTAAIEDEVDDERRPDGMGRAVE